MSLQSYLISREPSTSNYLTLASCWIKWSLRSDRYSKHIQGKCGTRWLHLLTSHELCSRRNTGDPDMTASRERVGWGVGWTLEAVRAGRGQALTFPCLRALWVPAADYKMCSGCCFQRAQVLLMTAYFWIPGANAWSVMTFRGVFTRPASD